MTQMTLEERVTNLSARVDQLETSNRFQEKYGMFIFLALLALTGILMIRTRRVAR